MTGDDDARDLGSAQAHFARFAAEYPDLPLYRSICLGAASDAETASLLLAARPGQVRPVLWLAALHDLVLRQPDLPAARWFPSVVGRQALPDGDPWPDVRRTVLDHRDELREVIATHSTQTNEVNRCVYLAAALVRCSADVRDVPIVLVEMGASAGLLLGVDRYRVELESAASTTVLGSPDSPVRCFGHDRSPTPTSARRLPPILARAGLDLDPVALDDVERLRWLEACLWPDVPGRIERFTAAVETLRGDPPRIHAGDMVEDLGWVIDRTATASAEAHVVVFSSWALTYVARDRRDAVADVIDGVATHGGPVSWVTAEPVGSMPGITLPQRLRQLDRQDSSTVLAARLWRGGRESDAQIWGTCHPHGEWIRLES